jgi:hypothetical protein
MRATRLLCRVTLVGLSLLSLAACGTTRTRGGRLVPRGQEPPGRVLQHYRARGCVDRAGQRTTARFGNVWLVRVSDGQDVIVSTMPGYDSLVVDNEFVAGGERVFQLSLESGPSRDVLLDYRLPVVGDGPGRAALVRTWREVRGRHPTVRAYFEWPAVVCRLEPAPITPVASDG